MPKTWSYYRKWLRYDLRCSGLCSHSGTARVELVVAQPVTRSFGIFFDLRLNQQLSKQWRRWWFETPSHSLWCQCNAHRLWHFKKQLFCWAHILAREFSCGHVWRHEVSIWLIVSSPLSKEFSLVPIQCSYYIQSTAMFFRWCRLILPFETCYEFYRQTLADNMSITLYNVYCSMFHFIVTYLFK